MLERDWFMRQVRQLSRVLQQVLLQKQQNQVSEARRTIQQAIGQLDDEQRDNLRGLSLEETIEFCERDGAFRPEFATRIADLLKEEGDLLTAQGNDAEATKSYARALLLYRRAMHEKESAVSWNIGSTLSDLKAHVGEATVKEIERVLEA